MGGETKDESMIAFPEEPMEQPAVTLKKQKTVSTLVSDGLSSELAAELLRKFGR